MPEPWTHREGTVNGVRLHWVEAGPAGGPLVVLLHGFPQLWSAWRHQIPALAAAGFRVLAPDMRGYNASEKPPGVSSYRLDRLAGDVVGLIHGEGCGRASVVGHDWGGVIAWELALTRPEVLGKLVVLNAPHPAAYAREVRRLDQARRSWYVAFFQLPLLPELSIRAGGFASLRSLLRADPARPGAFSGDDIRRHVEAAAVPGALTATVNYYRAALRCPPTLGRVEAPTLVVWSLRDRFLSPRLIEGLEPWVPNLRVECLPEASHWVMADEPERVNELLVEFLAA